MPLRDRLIAIAHDSPALLALGLVLLVASVPMLVLWVGRRR